MARRSYSRRAPAARGSYRRSSASVRRGPARRPAGRARSGSRGGQTLRIVVQTAPAPAVLGHTAKSVRDDRAKF